MPETRPTEHTPTQPASRGTGPLYHRVYRIDFSAPKREAESAFHRLLCDPDHFSPQWLATFKKTHGCEGPLKLGDAFDVKLSAPWPAPVRVSAVGEHEFTLATLEGHLEAGKIQFRLEELGRDKFRFEIESVARSRDKLVDLLYDKIPICRAAQKEMWVEFCQSFAEEAMHSKDVPEVATLTEKRDEKTGAWEKV